MMKFNLKQVSIVRDMPMEILNKEEKKVIKVREILYEKRYVAVLNKFGNEHRISVYDKWEMSYVFTKWGKKDPDLMIEDVLVRFKKCYTTIIDKRNVEYYGN